MNIFDNWNLNKVSNHIILCIKKNSFDISGKSYQLSWQKNISFKMFRLKDFEFGHMKSSLSIVNIFLSKGWSSLTVVLHVWILNIEKMDNDI